MLSQKLLSSINCWYRWALPGNMRCIFTVNIFLLWSHCFAANSLSDLSHFRWDHLGSTSSVGMESTGFRLIHSGSASDSFTKSQLFHMSSVRTRWCLIPDSLSSVIGTFPFTWSNFPIVCKNCTQHANYSRNWWIAFTLTPEIPGSSRISLGFHDFWLFPIFIL